MNIRPDQRCAGSALILPADSSTRHVCEQCGRTIRVSINPANGVTRMVAFHKPAPSQKELIKAKGNGRGPGRPPKPVERETVTYVCYACRGHRYVVLPVQRGQIALPKACPTCAGSGTVSVQSTKIDMIKTRVPTEL